MAVVCLGSLFEFHIPAAVLSHVQQLYYDDVCEATVELVHRTLDQSLEGLPRSDPWSRDQFVITCYPLCCRQGFSLLISVGAAAYGEEDEELKSCMEELREHWIRSAGNMKCGGAYNTISHLRSLNDPQPDPALLQQVTVKPVANRFRLHY